MAKKINRTLIVVSNHNVLKWEQAQREGWDTINYIQHPIIPADMSSKELNSLVISTMEDVKNFIDIENIDNTYFCIQGDYGFTYRLQREIASCFYISDEQFVFPTTERISNEIINSDGSITKNTTFKFVQWR